MPKKSFNEKIEESKTQKKGLNDSVVDIRSRLKPKKEAEDEKEEEPKQKQKGPVIRWDLEIKERDDNGAIRKVSLVPIYVRG